jgi:hypothetical protein
MSVGIALFGAQNYLCYLEDVEIKGKQGERLALCYKFSIHCFFLPLWWTRDGYVLGIIETNAKSTKSWLAKTFYPLTEKNITRGQASGHLPKPLPSYKITFGDSWPVGFGWLMIGIAVLNGLMHGL